MPIDFARNVIPITKKNIPKNLSTTRPLEFHLFFQCANQTRIILAGVSWRSWRWTYGRAWRSHGVLISIYSFNVNNFWVNVNLFECQPTHSLAHIFCEFVSRFWNVKEAKTALFVCCRPSGFWCVPGLLWDLDGWGKGLVVLVSV